jgi:hypothetical protein
MPIEFQGYSGPSTPPAGCEIYQWGFTSGCIDPNTGENRGFTQEWYYDDTVGAWIAVTVGGGGDADFENAGPTYTSETHNAPTVTGSGNIRKFAFLDPDTGALTFDYVNTYDLLNPNERVFTFVHTGSDWLGLINGQAGLVRASSLGSPATSNDGVTLCRNPVQICQISSSGANGIRFYPNGSSPSPFSPLPVGVTLDFVGNGTNSTQILSSQDPSSASAQDLPYFYDAGEGLVNGNNTLPRNKFYLGFTANGPSYRAVKIQMNAIAEDDSTIGILSPQAVSTENNYYVVVLGAGLTIGDITASTITNAANGTTSGYRFLMCPTNNSTNNRTRRTLTYEQLGGEDAGNETRVYMAFPTRSEVDASNHLWWDAGSPSAPKSTNGFVNNTEAAKEITIANELGYSESYNVFRSQQLGVSNNGIKIDTTGTG